MVSIYIGSTTGYSGKNLLAMSLGLKFRNSGFNVGYMKPVGAVPHMDGDTPGDADAAFIQQVLGLEQDPAKVTPVLVTRDFTIKAFSEDMGDLMPSIVESYQELSSDKDVMILGGSGSYLSSGTYCGVSGPDVSVPSAQKPFWWTATAVSFITITCSGFIRSWGMISLGWFLTTFPNITWMN